MDEKGKLFGKINIIDFIVVSFVILALAVIIGYTIIFSRGKDNPHYLQQKQFYSDKESALDKREKELNNREKELSFKEKELSFLRKESDIQKKELDIQRKELAEGLQKEKLQNWIEGVKEGVRLKIQKYDKE